VVNLPWFTMQTLSTLGQIIDWCNWNSKLAISNATSRIIL